MAAFASIAGLVLAGPAQATPSLYPGALVQGSSNLPGGSQMVSADFNGDGLMDLAVVDDTISYTNAGGVWVFLAQAGGGYAAPVFYPTASKPYTIAVGDLNGDGHPDIVTGNQGSSSSGQVSVLIGNGDGTFQPAVNYALGSTAYAQSITVGDATGNGKADVVLGTDSSVFVIPGNGDGTLDTAAEQTLTLNNGASYGVAVTDLNADGQPDIVAADGCSSSGTADTVDVYTGQSGGIFLATPSQTVAVGACPTLAVGDLNGDGAPDVAVANRNDSTVQVLLNSAGMLADSGTTYTLPADSGPEWTRLADVDGDGHLDILAPNAKSDTVSVLYGQGNGSFAAPVEVPMGALVNDVAAVPAASGSASNLVALDHPNATFLTTARNLGNRNFYSYADYPYQNASRQGQDVYEMVSADFNGDGHPDLVTANKSDSTLSVLLNNGGGDFGAPTILTLPSGGGFIYATAVGDVNGDGKADIVTADSSGHLYTFLGNGDGTFQAPLTSTIAVSKVDGIALGDVNGDGKLDVAVTEKAVNQVQICTGDDTGQFDCSAETPLAVNAPDRVTLTDLTGNGKLDLVVTSQTTDPSDSNATDAYVFLGDGTGGFGASPSATLPVVGSEAWGIAVGDVNGDGYPDLVFGSKGNHVSVFLGNGDGTFGAGATYASGIMLNSDPFYVALADVNSDGHPDIVAADDTGGIISLLTNKGDGTFNTAINYASGFYPSPVLVLDVDGDGLPDIVAANYGYGKLATSTVSVYLHNHAPVVTGTSLTVNENTSGTGTVTATDPEQDPLTFAVATQPGHGTVNLDATTGSFTYTPANDYTGSDSFTVTATNGLETSAPATVSITVNPVNQPPVAQDGTLTTDENKAANGTLVASDPDGDPLTFSIVSQPNHGTVTIDNTSSGAYTYTPSTGYSGSDSFTFKANDGQADSNIATVSITVNHPPVAQDGTLTTDENKAANGTLVASDPDGDPLTFSIVSQPNHGTVTIDNTSSGAYTYTPSTGYSGSDSFTFKANDGQADSNIATVSITVKATPPPTPPPSGGGGGGALGLLSLLVLGLLLVPALRRRLG